MSVTRRRFLKTSVLSAIAAGCAFATGLRAFGQDLRRSNPARDFPVPFEAQQSPLFYYTRETFEPYVGGVFRGRATGGGTALLTLVAVKGYSPAAGTKLMTRPARQTRSFTLTFRANRPLTDLTSVHQLEHAALGKFELMLTRSTDARGRFFYEAVINHLA
jgi:hypothetical protein